MHPPTVFVIDDDIETLDSLEQLIKSVRLPVETYRSAAEFLAGYDPQRPGCLVLDVRMPETSGLELQERLAEADYPLSIIIVTGYADVPMSVKALQSGAFDFLEKPVNKQVLLDRIQAALAHGHKLHERRKLLENLRQRVGSLTARERELMELLLSGKTMPWIVELLGISKQTVSKHRTTILEKMGAANEVDLCRLLLPFEEELLGRASLL